MVGRTLISDNGPYYTTETFTNMMKEYGVSHIKRSPHYPQSNRLAEKYVQIIKNMFHKAKEDGKDMFKCLIIYHNTPLSSNLNLLCKYYIIDAQDQTCQCLMWQDTNLVWSQSSLEANTRMNICLHMTYTWVSMSCFKIQQTSGGFQQQ